MRRLSRALPFLAFLAILLLPVVAFARPGGGQSYSGGSHGSSGGSGGGGGGCIFLIFQLWLELIFRHPLIGIPLTIVVIAVFISYQKRRGAASSQAWDSAPAPTPMAYQAPASRASRDLDDVRQLDPEFSVVLFQDFAYALYAKAHKARSNPRDLESLSPYLGQSARDQLAQRRPVGAPVSGVVIGAMRVVSLSIPTGGAAPAASADTPQPQVIVLLEFESNMTVGAEQTHYVRERWRLVRDVGVQSKPPEQVGSFHCPNCGAPFGPEGGDRCEYCGQVVSGGKFDWSVASIDLLQLEERPPALTSDVQEMGTDLPTIQHPALNTRWAELVRDDPAVTQDALAARFGVIYDELNAAWTKGDLAAARPYVSDGLFDYLRYWVTAYHTQGLRNVLEGMRIVQWKAVKIIRDRHYDSLTIRLWGSGRDYTVRQATGELVSGNPKRDRLYSEYWTLIRGAGVKGAPRTDKTCPNCGASLDVNMAGDCEHCGAKITSGAFDWVLSTIEQDDSYTG
ncbi:MAG TPA: TIM44-like domain-containing protein [Thermoanaerobaculia bacterium]|jgi:predicted lipid-binding transport protein (Tim44 family)|nr:TIM44-like domain-containing protein [Thermoanaerobaculia bacterium]